MAKPVHQSPDLPEEDYDKFLAEMKELIETAQVKAALAVNQEMILLYWQIGREILNRQKHQGWGANVVNRLSKDLGESFPDVKGFSPTNLNYMRKFADAHPDKVFLQQAVVKIPWGHNCVILDKLKDPEQRTWYIRKTIEHGWSRNVLVHQIERSLFQRQGKAITNFDLTLPKPQSELAQQILKNPYTFDFLNLGEEFLERELEKALINHIRDFLLELGVGFAFIGSQYHIEVDEKDFYIDLLFYHTKLHSYVVIDLKIEEFKPEFAGKMSFYIEAVNDILKDEIDQPTIGMILCKSKSKTVAEYSLKSINKPMSVSVYNLEKISPEIIREKLPSIEQIETELSTISTNIEEIKTELEIASKQEEVRDYLAQPSEQRKEQRKKSFITRLLEGILFRDEN